MSRSGAQRWAITSGMVKPLVPPATVLSEATSKRRMTARASLPPRFVSMISATDCPFEAMSCEMAPSSVLLIWFNSVRVSRSLRSRSWAPIR